MTCPQDGLIKEYEHTLKHKDPNPCFKVYSPIKPVLGSLRILPESQVPL